MYYFYNFGVNFENVCYSYVVIESCFFVCCYNLNFCSVNHRVIYFDCALNLRKAKNMKVQKI